MGGSDSSALELANDPCSECQSLASPNAIELLLSLGDEADWVCPASAIHVINTAPVALITLMTRVVGEGGLTGLGLLDLSRSPNGKRGNCPIKPR